MEYKSNLIHSYERFKLKSFYGVGQRKAKLFMNSIGKEIDKRLRKASESERDAVIREKKTVMFIRQALECEDYNINAKKYRNTSAFSYRDKNYENKHKIIGSLIGLARDLRLSYGYAMSDEPATRHVIYFELPETGEQISFHATFREKVLKNIPKYTKEWDGKLNSTLYKIERAFCFIYGEKLKEKYNIVSAQS